VAGGDVVSKPVDLDAARRWIALCACCDAATGTCTCPEGDFRVVMGDLIAEIEGLREALTRAESEVWAVTEMGGPLKVTATDAETGKHLGEQLVVAGDYVLLCHAPCYLANTQTYPLKGTHVLTIKGHAPKRGAR
jgi:hypothetical protein